MTVENSQIADVFDEIADLLELQGGNQFRVRSYQNAARTVRNLSGRLEDMVEKEADLTEIPNLGQSTAGKVREILDRGTCKRLENLRSKAPSGVVEFMKIPQLGPRKAMQIHKALNIDAPDDLKKACENHKVRELEGFGAKTEEKILKGLEMIEGAAGRFLYHDAVQHVESLRRHLSDCEAIRRCEVAGSFRRKKETVGDLDILIHAGDRGKAIDHIVSYENLEAVLSKGRERASVRLGGGLQVDFRFFEPSAFGAAILYFTGSKAHSVQLRKRARERDWKLNEYGLFKGKKRLAGKTEASVYHRLNLPCIPPELREDRGEIAAAEEGELPKLVDFNHIHGDLHCHTDETDGALSIEEMAGAATKRGRDYLAITDHSQAVTVAKGLDGRRLRKHVKRIREVDKRLKDIWLLAGIEVDIMKNGDLDLDAGVLAELDWVVASIHSHMSMSAKDMTKRLVKAVSSGVIHCLGHPTARLIGKRAPIEFDVETVFSACREHGVCVEIDAQPDRMDLSAAYCQRARELGVKVSIGTDAHKENELDFLALGVNMARRGWLERTDVINAKTVKQLKQYLARR